MSQWLSCGLQFDALLSGRIGGPFRISALPLASRASVMLSEVSYVIHAVSREWLSSVSITSPPRSHHGDQSGL